MANEPLRTMGVGWNKLSMRGETYVVFRLDEPLPAGTDLVLLPRKYKDAPDSPDWIIAPRTKGTNK